MHPETLTVVGHFWDIITNTEQEIKDTTESDQMPTAKSLQIG